MCPNGPEREVLYLEKHYHFGTIPHSLFLYVFINMYHMSVHQLLKGLFSAAATVCGPAKRCAAKAHFGRTPAVSEVLSIHMFSLQHIDFGQFRIPAVDSVPLCVVWSNWLVYMYRPLHAGKPEGPESLGFGFSSFLKQRECAFRRGLGSALVVHLPAPQNFSVPDVLPCWTLWIPEFYIWFLHSFH